MTVDLVRQSAHFFILEILPAQPIPNVLIVMLANCAQDDHNSQREIMFRKMLVF